MIDNSYEGTSIFIFHVWVLAGYIIIPYNQVFSHLKSDFYKVGVPVDPEQPSAHYYRLATYCHVCLSIERGVKPFLSDGYRNIYPLRIRLRIISMSSHVNQLFAGQEMASLLIVDSVVFLDCRMYSRRNHSGIIRLSL